jgi:hypothetical protein
LPVPDALGYHATLGLGGKPVAYIAVAGVTDFTGSPNALSVTISHECLETAADPPANRWEDRGDGTLLALEVCDEVEDTAYVAPNGVYVSNFLFQSYFSPGSMGPYDQLGILTAQGQETPGGYSIFNSGGHDGPAAAIELHAALKELPTDVGVATHGRFVTVTGASPARTQRHTVVYASKRPRESKIERKNHPTSRSYRRGLRFGWHTPPAPPAPTLKPAPALPPLPSALRR